MTHALQFLKRLLDGNSSKATLPTLDPAAVLIAYHHINSFPATPKYWEIMMGEKVITAVRSH